MEKITRYHCEHVLVQRVYVRSGILHACMENQYQIFPPEIISQNFIFLKLETTGGRFCRVGVTFTHEGTETLIPSEFDAGCY